MDRPRVLIISEELEKSIALARNLGATLVTENNAVRYYLLIIDNKYYTAEITLCASKELLGGNPADEQIEGVIIYQTVQNEINDDTLKKWSSFITSLSNAEVRIFVCDTMSETQVRDRVESWCTENKFESVELECSNLDEIIDLQHEHNKFGLERIVEALHAYRWPNIILKNGAPAVDIGKVAEQVKNITLENANDFSERLKMESVLDGIMNIEDTDFGELFGQLKEMREHAATLPINERRIAAEQLVSAIWKAIGGDASEVEDESE